MKGIGWIVVLLALLIGMFIVAKDMNSLTGERDGKVVVEPLEQAQETANKLNKLQDSASRRLDEINE